MNDIPSENEIKNFWSSIWSNHKGFNADAEWIDKVAEKYKNIETQSWDDITIEEFHYSTKKREHCFSILKAFFVRHSSEYETSDSDRKVKRNI